jgi:hypothetical protein
MKPSKISAARITGKAPTGIEGFDDITHGGLPRGRTTLLEGGPGSGKTLFALRFLVHGAQDGNEPGIFVAFEETSKRIAANAEGFGWNLGELQKKKLFFLDAQPTPDLIQSGNFDLSGMLAALGAQAAAMGLGALFSTRWILCWHSCPTRRRNAGRFTGCMNGCSRAGSPDWSRPRPTGMTRVPSVSNHSASCNSWWTAPWCSTTAWNLAFPNAISGSKNIAARTSTKMKRRS